MVVLENKTGRILAMTGGFSYPLSQLNRTTQALRQPGSAIKPLSYLAALGKGLQPNTLVSDDPITLPPIGGGRAREQDYWTPKNYDGGAGGTFTLRRALENSRNLATVHLLDGGIETKPEASLDRLCELAVEAQIYRECVRYYPFVLGAQPVRPIDLAAFYAAIANEGVRPVTARPSTRSSATANDLSVPADAAGHDQLRRPHRLLSAQDHAAGRAGARHRARDRAASRPMSPARPAPRTRRTTPGSSASPMTSPSRSGSATTTPTASAARSAAARPAAAWRFRSSSRSSRRCGPMSRRRPRSRPPSPEAKRQLTCKSIDLESGEMQSSRGKAVSECFRIDAKGRVLDTRYRLVSQGDANATQGNKERRTRPSVRIAKPIRPMPAPSNQVPSAYDNRYGWDNNGRYTYQDFWRGSSQPNPQLPRTDQYQRANPFWSNRY